MSKNTLPVFNPAMLDSNGAIVWGDLGVGMVTLTLEGIDSSKYHVVQIQMSIFDITPELAMNNNHLPSYLKQGISYLTEGVKKAVDEGKSILIVFDCITAATPESAAVLKKVIEERTFFGYELTEKDTFVCLGYFDSQGKADYENLDFIFASGAKQFQFVTPVQ